MFWTMWRVCGSIMIGPRGLSGFLPFLEEGDGLVGIKLALRRLSISKIAGMPSHSPTEGSRE
jgi:hypothetical protein